MKFYNNEKLEEFHGAMLTRMYKTDTDLSVKDEEKDDQAVGFLFAAFYSRTDKDTGKPIYIGMAFPGIKYEQRTEPDLSKRLQWNRQDFYKMFLGFYLRQIFIVLRNEINNDDDYKNNIQDFQKRINTYNLTETSVEDEQYKKDIIAIIKYLQNKEITIEDLNKTIKIPPMQIEAFAENPFTYQDFCEFGFVYNVKPPNVKFENMAKDWSVADLLHYSYIESNNPNPPDFLEKELGFTVNLTPLEWRLYFEIAIKEKKYPMIYYLWQNFNFPNSAFKVTIPLNAENFWNVVKGRNQKDPNGSSTFDEDFVNDIENIISKKSKK